MRIAYVCMDPGVPVFGRKGCSVHIQEMLRAFGELGMEVELFAIQIGEVPQQPAPHLRVQSIPFQSIADQSRKEEALLALNDDLVRMLQNGEFDLIYERYSLWSFGAVEFARKAGIPSILEVNSPLIDEQERHRKLVHRELAEEVARKVFGLASTIVAVSRELAETLAAYPETKGRIQIVPNGVNPNRFPRGLPPACPAPHGTFTVGFLGSLKAWHGLHQLSGAFRLVHAQDPSVRLLIVGDGPKRQDLLQDLDHYGLLPATQLVGSVAPAEVPGMLASMDVAVAPYPSIGKFYFSPLKVFEYMAAQLPVVASQIGQIQEIIEDEVNGLLCPPGNPVALATAINRLREHPELRDKLGMAARSAVLRNHTWNTIAQRILKFAKVEALPSGGYR